MEKYSFVLEFETKEDLFSYIINMIKPGRCIRQLECTPYYTRDSMRGEDEKLYELLNHAPVAVIDLIYFKKQPPSKVVIEALDRPYAYCVEYGHIVKYYLHVEPPMVNAATHAVGWAVW